MPTGAASDNLDLLEFAEFGFRNADLVEKHPPAFQTQASEHRVPNGAGLLKNFLEHEVLVAALFGHDRIPKNVRDLAPYCPPLEVGKTNASRSENRDITVIEKKHIPRMAENSGDIGGNEELVLTEP